MANIRNIPVRRQMSMDAACSEQIENVTGIFALIDTHSRSQLTARCYQLCISNALAALLTTKFDLALLSVLV